jgi:hypothetical protein
MCEAMAYVHVTWKNPVARCKNCREKQKARREAARNRSPQSRKKTLLKQWKPVSGGLPSLGRRK